MSGKVRGEYWIVDGRVDFADGDVGEQNHEMVALNSVASDHLESLADYAEELGIDASESRWTDEPFPTATELLGSVHSSLVGRGIPSVQASTEIIRRLGINMEVYKMLGGGGDARLYVMREDGWIAVRSNNIELFGYDQSKKESLVSGLEDILDQEGVEDSDEDVEFSLYDHRTKRSSDVTLADLKGASAMRPQTLPSTTYNRPIMIPADRSKPMGSQSPRRVDIATRSAQQTSESGMGFRSWLAENSAPLMIRRSWPGQIALGAGEQANPTSRRTRRVRRR